MKRVTLLYNAAGNALGWNPDGATTTFTISEPAVTTPKIADDAVTAAKIKQDLVHVVWQ